MASLGRTVPTHACALGASNIEWARPACTHDEGAAVPTTVVVAAGLVHGLLPAALRTPLLAWQRGIGL